MENPAILNADRPAQHKSKSADLLKDFANANFNCKSYLENLEGVKAQISERELSYQDVLLALQSGNHNGCGPSPGELQRYAKVLWTQITEMTEHTRSLRADLLRLLNQTYSLAAETFTSLINGELYRWKVKQKFSQIGPRSQTEAIATDLDQLEPLFETFGEALRHLLHHIAILEKDFKSALIKQCDDLHSLRNSVTSLLEDFIKQSVVVTQQPPSYLMKTRQPTGANSNKASGKHPCQPALRVLGGQSIGCRVMQPKDGVAEVKCFLISEEQAKNVNSGRDLDEKGCGKLLHNTTVFEMVNAKEYCAEFKRPLQLVSIDRPADEHEYIPRQRYYLAFLVTLPSVQKPFWKLSLPVAALVHPRQARDQGADAYMFWEYAFSQGDGILTHVPREHNEGVPWPQMAEALQLKFMQLIEGQKSNETAQYTLTDGNLVHIAERLFGPRQSYDNCRLHWERFFQVPLENLKRENDDTPVAFWEWFYKTAEIIQKHLLFQWNRGLVIGFCSRMHSENLLAAQQSSSLMVKFSDTQFGFLIISYRFPNKPVQHLRVRAEDLARIPVENCILDIPDLQSVEFVYPDRPVSEFRAASIKKEKNGRKSPDKQNQNNTDGIDPYFRKVSIGFRVEAPLVWEVPTPPQNWENMEIQNMDFQEFQQILQNMDMNVIEQPSASSAGITPPITPNVQLN